MDDVIYLIDEGVISYDDNGNEIIDPEGRMVFCQIYGVTRNEFYQAAQVNLQPEITVKLSSFLDYKGEKLARYHGQLYSVVRTSQERGSGRSGMNFDAIELTLERKTGNVRR